MKRRGWGRREREGGEWVKRRGWGGGEMVGGGERVGEEGEGGR